MAQLQMSGVAQLQIPVRFRPAPTKASERDDVGLVTLVQEGKSEKARKSVKMRIRMQRGVELLQGNFHASWDQRCSRRGFSSPDFCRLPSTSRFQAQYSPKRSSA